MSTNHPDQPLIDGRFKKNRIVEYLLDHGPFDLNKLAMLDFSDEDHQQFAQLIGYSLGGYSELSYVSDEAFERLVVADPTDPWTGEGHPPAGITCEITTNDGRNWRPVKIIFFDDYVTMIGEVDGKVNRELFKRCDADVSFRPIPTDEQIVTAVGRENEAKALYFVINNYDNATPWEGIAEERRNDYRKAIDAGYRKTEGGEV